LEWYFDQLEKYLNYYEKAIEIFGKKISNNVLNKFLIDSILLNEIEKFDKKRIYINEKNINEIYPLIFWFNENFYELKDNYTKSRDKILKHMKTINEHQENLWSSPSKGFLTPTEMNENNENNENNQNNENNENQPKYNGPRVAPFMSKLHPEKHIPKINLLFMNKPPYNSRKLRLNFMK
jgi:hypothetical protein